MTDDAKETKETKENEDPKAAVKNLADIESVINEYARKKVAARFKVPENKFRITLTRDTQKGSMLLSRGPIVNIYLLWPEAQTQLKPLIESAFRQIRDFKLVDSLAIEPVAYIRSRNFDKKKWFRSHENDPSNIVFDLIPKERMRVTRSTTIIVEDSVTGLKVTKSIEEKNLRYQDHSTELWMNLSRMVRETTEEIEDGTE